MPSHLISLPRARGPVSGTPLGSSPVHVSKSAVHGNTQKPVAIGGVPVMTVHTLAQPPKK
jgi:hypothetical protein